MRLALECPTRMLEQIQPFADFDWVLADRMLKEPEYAKYYAETGKVKFLDNSVNELGEPLDLEQMAKAREMLGPSTCYIVSPDWLGDSRKTLEAYASALKLFPPQFVVPVLQGASFEEVLDCLGAYMSVVAQGARIILSIPYDIASERTDPPELMSLRRALVVSQLPKEVSVHLLGFTSLNEFIWYKDRHNVLSIDTGLPILLGLQGKGIEEPILDKSVPTLNQMDTLELNAKGWTSVCRNIALFRTFLA